MDRFALLLAGIALAFGIISYALDRVFRQKKFIKYILPILSLGISAYYFIIGVTQKSGQGFQDLGNVLLAILILSGSIGGFLTSIVLDIRKKR